MEIYHKSHEHPLLFIERESEENQDEVVVCWGCQDLICGPRFSCYTCKFHLHKSCTELPLTLLNHPLHPQHPLSLLPCSAYGSRDFVCNACHENGNGFVYHCSECSFDLHITCALSNDEEGHIVSEATAEKDRFQYGLNQHDLVSEEELSNPLETNNVDCFGCSESISAPFFSCSRPRCKFRIHKFCANLPKQIKVSFLPHEQSLFLVPKSSESCQICSQKGISFYVCLKYDLFIHPRCALNPMDTMKRVDEKHIQHRSHHHNLTLHEDETECASIENDRPSCSLCMRKLESSLRYSCELCPFILHKSCAELPGQVKSHLHPKHPLILFAITHSTKITNCGYCDEEVRSFNFYCLLCGFILRLDCFLSLHNHDHQHNYVKIKIFRKLACDACGEEGYFSPRQCTQCHLMVHKKCVDLPRFLKVGRRHHHVLKLTFFLCFLHECDRLKCQLCYREINVDYAAYYCHQCNYAVHLSCGHETGNVVSVEETQENSNTSFVESSLEGSHNSVGNKGSILTPFNVGNTHQHELALYEKDPEDHKYCEACVTLISSPFYSCNNCDFHLHKQCAEMLESYKLELYPFHLYPHLLHLNKVKEYKACYVCEKYYNGFLYSCLFDGCGFDIDFHCIKLVEWMNGIDHPCHEHKLFFPNPKTRGSEKCQGCGSFHNLILVCSECEYVLGFCCAKLPHRIKHRYDDHLLNLATKDKDNFGEYYCDICENERDPKYWFYCCKTCDFFAHIKCALGDFPYIKFGTTRLFGFHEHPLTYVEQPTRKPPPICHQCDRHCYSKVLECSQCSFAVHFSESCTGDMYSFFKE